LGWENRQKKVVSTSSPFFLQLEYKAPLGDWGKLWGVKFLLKYENVRTWYCIYEDVRIYLHYKLIKTMAKEEQNLPTESELEVLNILWELGESSVRTVNEKLNEKREVGYTTTLKIMQIMHEKGLVLRDDNQKIHLYSPKQKEQKIKGNLLTNLIENTFNGSFQNLMMTAIKNQKISKSDLESIKNLIKDHESKNK
jgi:BlaI family transcriptional regulator, penicillinase repressor